MTIGLIVFTQNGWAVDAKLASTAVKASSPITVEGNIAPGEDLYVVNVWRLMF